MSDDLAAQLLALYRAGADAAAGAHLDAAILGRARRAAWLDRNRMPLLAAACGLLALGVAGSSALAPHHRAFVATYYGLHDGPPLAATAAGDERPGLNVHPGMTVAASLKLAEPSGE